MTTPTQIKHTVHLLPQDTTLAELDHITSLLHINRSTFTFTADAAHAITFNGTPNSVVAVWGSEHWKDSIFDWLHQRGIETAAFNMNGIPVPNHISNPKTPRQTPQKIDHTIHLLPQDTTLPELKQVNQALYPNRTAFTYSADAAHALMYAGNSASTVVVWSGNRWSGNIYAWFKARGVQNIKSHSFDDLIGDQFIFTHWPTDYVKIIQAYNANPAIYQAIGIVLTAHEGVDIQAPMGSNIYAAAKGKVYLIRKERDGHNYGNAIYIQHENGYRTAYAHLLELAVNVNDEVVGGQFLGKGDSTGNVWPKDQPLVASHLHLTLYKDGATRRGETKQPYDIIDPTPYLQPLIDGTPIIEGEMVQGWGYASSLEVNGLTARVIPTFIYLRATPGTNQPDLGRVPNGTVVRITGQKEQDYYPIAVPASVFNRKKPTLEVGLHNRDGADWMLNNGLKGWALVLTEIGTTAQPIDATKYEQAGIKILVRLNYHYSPRGNIPAADSADYEKFIQACTDTMLKSKGVWGFIFGNETNNPAEYPDDEAITPEYYAQIYNRLWFNIPTGVKMGVQAIDPYFGPGSDSRDYWERILKNISGADFLTVHPKTQDSDPDNVDSKKKFTDDPLRWQYLHLSSYQPLLDVVPPNLQNLPVIATEVNPQRHNNGKLGWQKDKGAEWVKRAVKHFKTYNETATMPVTGVIFYRFSVDDWRISDKPDILNAIKDAA